METNQTPNTPDLSMMIVAFNVTCRFCGQDFVNRHDVKWLRAHEKRCHEARKGANGWPQWSGQKAEGNVSSDPPAVRAGILTF